MSWFFQTLTAAAIAFAATNLDDIVVLMLLFAQNESYTSRQIVFGQYLGFSILLLLSSLGFWGGQWLPGPWLGLLGLVPIALGVRAWLQRSSPEAVHLVGAVSWPLCSPQVASVAALTVANGGDNIGVYVSLFAGLSWSALGLTLLVFAALVAIWCGIAYSLVQHPAVGQRLTQYGHHLVPPVLIGLGGFILWEHETYRLFTR